MTTLAPWANGGGEGTSTLDLRGYEPAELLLLHAALNLVGVGGVEPPLERYERSVLAVGRYPIKVERRRRVELRSTDWQPVALAVELPPQIGGARGNRTLMTQSCKDYRRPSSRAPNLQMKIAAAGLTAL